MRKRHVLLLILMTFLIHMYGAFAGDWTKWRGPNGNGISTETRWNPMALKKNPKILWRKHVGEGHSDVSVSGNRLYTMSNTAKISDNDTIFIDNVLCIDTETGKDIWKFEYPCKARGEYPGPGSTPTVDGARVYTLSREGHLFCFDAQTGSVHWQRNVVDESLTKPGNSGLCCSPLVVETILILNAAESGLAFNKLTGELVWSSGIKNCSNPSPVPYTWNGKTMVLLASNRKVYNIDAKTGEVLWKHSPGPTDADPVVFDGKLLVPTYEKSTLLKLTDAEPVVIWKSDVKSSPFQSYVIVDGYAYGFSTVDEPQEFQCVDMRDGSKRWNVTWDGLGMLIASGDKLIISGQRGRLIIARASPEGFEEISSAKIFTMKDKHGKSLTRTHGCWIAPVLSEGKIFAKNSYGEIVCVDMR